MKFKLDIELVPENAWTLSLYNYFKANNKINEWSRIKKDIYSREDSKCWICGIENSRLEAHEFWAYDEKNGIQKLDAIHHLCSMCHKIKHIGYWGTDEGISILKRTELSFEDLINHFCRINKCKIRDFQDHKKQSFEIWRKRCKIKWQQDFGIYQRIMDGLKRPVLENNLKRTRNQFSKKSLNGIHAEISEGEIIVELKPSRQRSKK